MQKPDISGTQFAATTLEALPAGTAGVIRAVTVPGHAMEWARLLDEIGFVAGERVEVLVRGVPGGDPLAVRVGESTFALRRAEAACITVQREGGAQ